MFIRRQGRAYGARAALHHRLQNFERGVEDCSRAMEQDKAVGE